MGVGRQAGRQAGRAYAGKGGTRSRGSGASPAGAPPSSRLDERVLAPRVELLAHAVVGGAHDGLLVSALDDAPHLHAHPTGRARGPASGPAGHNQAPPRQRGGRRGPRPLQRRGQVAEPGRAGYVPPPGKGNPAAPPVSLPVTSGTGRKTTCEAQRGERRSEMGAGGLGLKIDPNPPSPQNRRPLGQGSLKTRNKKTTGVNGRRRSNEQPDAGLGAPVTRSPF